MIQKTSTGAADKLDLLLTYLVRNDPSGKKNYVLDDFWGNPERFYAKDTVELSSMLQGLRKRGLIEFSTTTCFHLTQKGMQRAMARRS